MRIFNTAGCTVESTNLPISTIIVNYNAGPAILEVINSVMHQTSEIIVVDNSSTDSSTALIASTYATNDKVKIVRNPVNLGFAAACNIGARRASYPYLFFLNPDCICGTQSLSRLYEVLAHYPRAGMVGGLLLNPDGTEQAGGRRLTPTPSRTFVRSFGLQRFARRWPNLLVDFNLHQQPLPLGPTPVEAISGACMLVKPEAIGQIGLWDEGYFLHCEDLDWCLRFTRANWDILFVPDAPFTHAQGTCSKSRPLFVEWHKHRGMSRFYLKFFRKNYPLPLLLLVLSAIWARFAVVGAASLLKSLRVNR